MSEDRSLPRRQRVSVMLTAHLARHDGTDSQHRVINLSETGVCIGQAAGLREDMEVLVSIGEVDHVPATVAWARTGVAGLRFQSEIDIGAARRRRPANAARTPTSGWIAERTNAYRRG